MSYKTLDNQLSPELEELLKPVMKEVKYTDTVFNKTCGGEAMSEDVKPEQWKLLFNKEFAEWRVCQGKPYNDNDFVKVIELEPTMRLMDEMARLLEFYAEYPEIGQVMQEYKKFKDGLK